MTWDFHKQFINGQWVPSTGSGRINVVNPATMQPFEWVPDGTLEDVLLKPQAQLSRLGRQFHWPSVSRS